MDAHTIEHECSLSGIGFLKDYGSGLVILLRGPFFYVDVVDLAAETVGC